MNRDKVIVRTSLIGILANIFLASFKAVVGILSSSIAIILDAVNNLSDVMSSVITIIGTKLAQKRPDKKHPYCYGRVENLSTTRAGKTTILIAHRISTIEKMDKILFIDDGALAAAGTHEALYETCPDYRKMVDLQRLEEEGDEHNA